MALKWDKVPVPLSLHEAAFFKAERHRTKKVVEKPLFTVYRRWKFLFLRWIVSLKRVWKLNIVIDLEKQHQLFTSGHQYFLLLQNKFDQLN
ncbi:hypothetical protein JOD43_003727 [Pullulanibacillus pueri]|uniref:hypothetical protein n=1 Tax=Pullulanibacillus pueri TaxID=1437324 RepID=UPI001669F530|nr:hypothetical protein [Pullulanibacillus pueri]MBM7683547.1 hypothetical protein [Pullulanibacillus pueri]